MKEEHIKALIHYRLEQADEALTAGGAMLNLNLHREVVNRSYYAMFYAVLALLCAKGKETSKHTGAISLFDMDFVKPGLIDRCFSKWLHEAFDLRLDSDYTPLFKVSHEKALDELNKAREFVIEAKKHLGDFVIPRG